MCAEKAIQNLTLCAKENSSYVRTKKMIHNEPVINLILQQLNCKIIRNANYIQIYVIFLILNAFFTLQVKFHAKYCADDKYVMYFARTHRKVRGEDLLHCKLSNLGLLDQTVGRDCEWDFFLSNGRDLTDVKICS